MTCQLPENVAYAIQQFNETGKMPDLFIAKEILDNEKYLKKLNPNQHKKLLAFDSIKSEDHYILKGKSPVATHSLSEWALSMEDIDSRRIGQYVKFRYFRLSTVFLGLNHSFNPLSKPILFETMCFFNSGESFQKRYTTYDDALKGHYDVLSFLIIKANRMRKKYKPKYKR